MCNSVEVKEDVCELVFAKGQSVDAIEYKTARGEMMIVHLDKDDKVLSIELIGDKKPCQTETVSFKSKG
jgi:hypothetical protein